MVRPGLDTSRFRASSVEEKRSLRSALNLPRDKKLFLFMGRFVQAKGLDYVLEALPLLPSDYMLVMVGDGQRKAPIMAQIQDRGLGSRVVLSEPTARPEDYYRACDVFVMSSIYEPLGQSILEAVATGMRLVAFHPETGVMTATHELGLDFAIDYSGDLSGEGLSRAMLKSMESKMQPDLSNIGSPIKKQLFCWKTLLKDLIHRQ